VRLGRHPALPIVNVEAHRRPTLAVNLDVGEAGHANKIDAAGDHEAPGTGDRLDTLVERARTHDQHLDAAGLADDPSDGFAYECEAFLANYHKRSNVETTFSMIKAKFGDSLLARSDVGQMNEALCKVLAHNIVCVIPRHGRTRDRAELPPQRLEGPTSIMPLTPWLCFL
jgi:hypothetical protein